jgi:hypothetical protein
MNDTDSTSGLSDGRIIEIRDEHLPSQGMPFDCIAFARSIEREARTSAGPDAADDLELAKMVVRGAGYSLVTTQFIIRFAEFIQDWRKGDFDLPELARLDVKSAFEAWQNTDNIAELNRAALNVPTGPASKAACLDSAVPAGCQKSSENDRRTSAPAPTSLPIAHLRSITHPDWLELCSEGEEGAFPVFAAPQVAAPATAVRAVLPDGWVAAPVEPTDDMEVAAENAFEQAHSYFPNWKSAYRAMLASLPECPGVLGASPAGTALSAPALRASAPIAGAEPCAYAIDDDTRVEAARQKDGSVLWAVRRFGDCMSRAGEWEHEPLPSSRHDAFIARCRFPSAEAAIAAARGIGVRSTTTEGRGPEGAEPGGEATRPETGEAQ